MIGPMNDGHIRVLLADDQDMVRTGFRFFLEAQPDIEVVAEACDGEQAVDLARRLRPDVCLMDIRMPRLDGLEATRLLAGAGVTAPLRVVVVTTFDLDEYVYAALRGGACGFLLKDSGPALLVEAVRAAAAGDALVSPSITVRLLRHITHAEESAAVSTAAPSTASSTPPATAFSTTPSAAPSTASSTAPLAEPLSERERDIVRLVAQGRTNQEIATALHISLSTVKTHLGSVQLKLGTRNRVEVAAHAWQSGLAADG